MERRVRVGVLGLCGVIKCIIFIMIDSEEEQKGSRLILPPVAGGKQSRSYQSIKEVLGVLIRKKKEYQFQLSSQEPNDQEYNLKYARCQTQSNTLERSDPKPNVLSEEELLARGSIVQRSSYTKTHKKRNRLLALQFHSTIQPIKVQKIKSRSIVEPSVESRNKSLQVQQQQQKLILQSRREQTPIREIAREREIVSDEKEESINLENIKLPEFLASRRSFSLQPKERNPTVQGSGSLVPRETPELPKEEMHLSKFKEIISDLQRGAKTNERLQRTIKSLESFNPFFRKIQRVIGVCLLRMGKIKQKQPNTILYQMEEQYSHFYIILLGQVKITGRNGMHKLCETGETLLEEVLSFPESKQKASPALEKAKVLQQSWILSIDASDLSKLQKQLTKFGFRQGLNEMRTLIKRNSIVKNWLRSKFALLQKR